MVAEDPVEHRSIGLRTLLGLRVILRLRNVLFLNCRLRLRDIHVPGRGNGMKIVDYLLTVVDGICVIGHCGRLRLLLHNGGRRRTRLTGGLNLPFAAAGKNNVAAHRHGREIETGCGEHGKDYVCAHESSSACNGIDGETGERPAERVARIAGFGSGIALSDIAAEAVHCKIARGDCLKEHEHYRERKCESRCGAQSYFGLYAEYQPQPERHERRDHEITAVTEGAVHECAYRLTEIRKHTVVSGDDDEQKRAEKQQRHAESFTRENI